MRSWILYKRRESELTSVDHGVNQLLLAARLEKINLKVYTPQSFDWFVDESGQLCLFLNQKRVDLPDVVIPRLGAEITDYGLALLRALELAGVYVCNGSHSIGLVKDKMKMTQMLRAQGLPTPKTMLVNYPISVALVEQTLGFPVVIKANSGAKGCGIHLCESAEQLSDLLELMVVQQCHLSMILQQFIASSYGRDVRVFVLGGRIVGCMQRIANHGFKANFSRGGRVEPFVPTSEMSELALNTAALFGLSIAGVDLLFDKAEKFTVCEANSSPGFKGLEQAIGGDIAHDIIRFIKDQWSQMS